MKHTKLIGWARVAIALCCIFLGSLALVREDTGYFGPGFLLLGLFILGHGRWNKLGPAILAIVRMLRSVDEITSRGMLKNYCAIPHDEQFCGELAYFEITLEEIGVRTRKDSEAPLKIKCCTKHYPLTPQESRKAVWADETLRTLKERKLTIKKCDMIWRPL